MKHQQHCAGPGRVFSGGEKLSPGRRRLVAVVALGFWLVGAETAAPEGISKSEAMSAAKTEVKSETKSEVKSDGKSEVNPAANPEAVKMLVTHDLAGIEGKEAIMLTVEYAPGGASLPHRHDANVFVYVLQGSVAMQVEGQPRVTLRAGQTFFEGPGDVHVVSANASATQPAKILVFMVKDKGAPPTRPAGK